jgi:hypothetical protein
MPSGRPEEGRWPGVRMERERRDRSCESGRRGVLEASLTATAALRDRRSVQAVRAGAIATSLTTLKGGSPLAAPNAALDFGDEALPFDVLEGGSK